ncbi:hypothetical protein [Dyadobacter sp. CY261]|nr:hypothetical protein [Dyadobacter sp. CY261]
MKTTPVGLLNHRIPVVKRLEKMWMLFPEITYLLVGYNNHRE